jgi:hypothetical protein
MNVLGRLGARKAIRGVSVSPTLISLLIRSIRKVNTNGIKKEEPASVKVTERDDGIDLSRTFFESTDISSIQSMENILSILQDAETQAVSPTSDSHPERRVSPFLNAIRDLNVQYLNNFTTQFGKQIIRYSVIYHFNLRPYLVSNPSLYGYDVSSGEFAKNIDFIVDRIMDEASKKQNSFFVRYPEINLSKKLSYAQSIVRYYVINPEHCLQRLKVDIKSATKGILVYDKEYRSYLLPSIQIPSSHRFIVHDPLVMRSSLGIDRSDRNMLAFMAMDALVISSSIGGHHEFKKREGENHKLLALDNKDRVSLFIGMMKCDEIEGHLAFSILCKRILLKIQESNMEKEELPGDVEDALPISTTSAPSPDPIYSDSSSTSRQYWETGILRDYQRNVYDDIFEIGKVKYDVSRPRREQSPLVRQVGLKRVSEDDRKETMPNDIEKLPEYIVDINYGDLSDEFLLATFIENPESIRDMKCVVAFKSRLHDRLIHSQHYCEALASSQDLVAQCESDDAVKDILVNYFDRFFGKFYGKQPMDAEKWLVNLVLAVETRPYLINETMVKEAIDGYKDLITELLFRASPDLRDNDKKK